MNNKDMSDADLIAEAMHGNSHFPPDGVIGFEDFDHCGGFRRGEAITLAATTPGGRSQLSGKNMTSLHLSSDMTTAELSTSESDAVHVVGAGYIAKRAVKSATLATAIAAQSMLHGTGRRTSELGLRHKLNTSFKQRYSDYSDAERQVVDSSPQLSIEEAVQHAFVTLVGIDRERNTYLVSPSGKYEVQHMPITTRMQEAITEYLIRTNQTEDHMEGLRLVVYFQRLRNEKNQLTGEGFVTYNVLPKQ